MINGICSRWGHRTQTASHLLLCDVHVYDTLESCNATVKMLGNPVLITVPNIMHDGSSSLCSGDGRRA